MSKRSGALCVFLDVSDDLVSKYSGEEDVMAIIHRYIVTKPPENKEEVIYDLTCDDLEVFARSCGVDLPALSTEDAENTS